MIIEVKLKSKSALPIVRKVDGIVIELNKVGTTKPFEANIRNPMTDNPLVNSIRVRDE